MKFEVSDLLFAGFPKYAMRDLSKEYGIEFFYEFGKDYYWDNEVAAWGKRSLSIHGPCVAVNLADKSHKHYAKIFAKTFAYAKKIKAGFVVVHTNEGWSGEREQVQNLVIRRLRNVLELGDQYGVQVLRCLSAGWRTAGYGPCPCEWLGYSGCNQNPRQAFGGLPSAR